jgi:hypothetical protein
MPKPKAAKAAPAAPQYHLVHPIRARIQFGDKEIAKLVIGYRADLGAVLVTHEGQLQSVPIEKCRFD